MPTATPSVETIVSAVVSAVSSAVGSGSTDVGYDHTYDDDVEWLKTDFLSGVAVSSVNAWIVDVASVATMEGPAPGENYAIVNVRIRYLSLRVNQATWSKLARQKWAAVKDALEKKASIFAISNQPQLRTPETIGIESHGRETISSAFWSKPQLVYRSTLGLTVEARIWGA